MKFNSYYILENHLILDWNEEIIYSDNYYILI